MSAGTHNSVYAMLECVRRAPKRCLQLLCITCPVATLPCALDPLIQTIPRISMLCRRRDYAAEQAQVSHLLPTLQKKLQAWSPEIPQDEEERSPIVRRMRATCEAAKADLEQQAAKVVNDANSRRPTATLARVAGLGVGFTSSLDALPGSTVASCDDVSDARELAELSAEDSGFMSGNE